jgi:LCP family protein required for cell wall assembly
MDRLEFQKPNYNQINLLEKDDNHSPKGKTRKKITKVLFSLAIVLLLAIFIFSYEVMFTDTSLMDNLTGLNIFKQLSTLAKGPEALKGYNDDRINILLMGIGGEGHDGPYLTDTLMLVSIQPSTQKVSMISIPRDLLVEVPQRGWWKINNVYYFGEKNEIGQGGQLTSEVVSSFTGIPIHYNFLVDFSGFEKVIDELDGLKVDVERSFTDYQYPTDDYKYQTIHFEKGLQTMDGETALKYVRSRHGNNGEAGDFSRSKRQQKILQALKERALSAKVLLNPKKISTILKTIEKHIDTNLELGELAELGKMSKDLDTQNLITVVLDDSPNGYLYAAKVNEAYVLRPRQDDFSAIKNLAQNIFATQEIATQKITANLEIKNGTATNGLAYRVSQEMKNLGYKILKIGNAPTQNYESTIIYDLTEEKNSETVKNIATRLNAQIETDIPAWIEEDADFSTSFYIILGNDQINENS